MSTYVSLGPRAATGVFDLDCNPGNWTVFFDPATLDLKMPFAEIYHLSIGRAHPDSTYTIIVDGIIWEWEQKGSLSPGETIPVTPGQHLYFFWWNAETGDPPKVTIWMRYDQDELTGIDCS